MLLARIVDSGIPRGGLKRGGRSGGEAEKEAGVTGDGFAELEGSAEVKGELAAEGEAEAGAAGASGEGRGEEASLDFRGETGTVVMDLELPVAVGVEGAEADDTSGRNGLGGVGHQVFEDEEGEIGGAIVEEWSGAGDGVPLDDGLAGDLGSTAAPGFGEEFVGGDFESGEALFIAEDADDVVDHGAHAACGIGGIGMVAGIGDGLLEGEERVAEAVDEVGGDGADGGGAGGEGEVAIGEFEAMGTVGEKAVGVLESVKGDGEGDGEGQADAEEGEEALAAEPVVETVVFGGEIGGIEGDEGEAEDSGRGSGLEREPDLELGWRGGDEVGDGSLLGGGWVGKWDGVGGAEEGGEESTFRAVDLDGEDTGETGVEGGGEGGGEGILAEGAAAGVVELLLDEGGEDAGIAMGDLIAELGAEGDADGGDGDAEEEEGAEEERPAVGWMEARLDGGRGRHRERGDEGGIGAWAWREGEGNQKSISAPSCQVLAR
jgi:hypothetical protein